MQLVKSIYFQSGKYRFGRFTDGRTVFSVIFQPRIQLAISFGHTHLVFERRPHCTCQSCTAARIDWDADYAETTGTAIATPTSEAESTNFFASLESRMTNDIREPINRPSSARPFISGGGSNDTLLGLMIGAGLGLMLLGEAAFVRLFL